MIQMNTKDLNGKKIYNRVMIIDDTPTDRYIATENIKRYSFSQEVIEMDSAEEALEYLESMVNTPDDLPELIFLDIRMPEMDGFGFLERYGQLPELVQNNCIIMMLSTSLNSDDHKRAEDNRFVKRFLQKPLTRSQLAELEKAA